MRSTLLILLLAISTCHAFMVSESLNSTLERQSQYRHTEYDGPEMNLVLFNNGISCLDGSSAGYYFRPASDATNTGKFIIHLEGGGFCNTSDSCHARTQTDLGSSNNWAPTRNQQLPYNMLDTDAGVNPDFHSWNHVWIPYCSGDTWVGTRVNATGDSWGLVFAGHSIVMAALDSLDAALSLANASDIIITGDSAGGIGTFWNIDYVTERYTTARVTGVPQCGWFTPGQNYSMWEQNGRQNLPYQIEITPGAKYYWGTVVQAYYPPACQYVNSNPLYCHNMPDLYPFIKTPLFVAENTMDQYQVYIQGGLPVLAPDSKQYIEYIGYMMRQSLQKVIASPKKDGLWAPACLVHEVTFSGPLAPQIQGQTFASTFGAYYFQRQSQGLQTQLVDNSADPTCFF